MLANLLVSAATLLAISTLAYLIFLAFRQKWVIAKFKKESRGMPIAGRLNPINGHISRILDKRNWRIGHEMIKLHGDTFGCFYGAQPVAATTDLDVIRRMIVENQEVDRIESFGIPLAELEEDSIAFASGDQWRKIRKAVAPAFSIVRLRAPNVQAEIRASIDRFVDSIERRLKQAEGKGAQGVIIDMDDLFSRFSLAQTLSSFYKQEDKIDFDAEKDTLTEQVDSAAHALTKPWISILVTLTALRPLLMRLSKIIPDRMFVDALMVFIKRQTLMNLEARNQVQVASDKLENEQQNLTLRDGTKFRRNMIDYVIDQYHDGNLTEREYYHSSCFLFGAAHKTTSEALGKLVYFLATHQDIQEKLRKSIQAIGSESEYLMWCTNEALRLFPPVPMGCSRTISKPLETKEGYVIPKGTFLVTLVYSIHRSEKYWGKDAAEFKPERWANQKDHHPMQFIPFGAGKRVCPGKEFSLHNIKTIMTILLQKYKFDYVPGKADVNDWQTPFMIFTLADGPLNIRITRLCASMK